MYKTQGIYDNKFQMEKEKRNVSLFRVANSMNNKIN